MADIEFKKVVAITSDFSFMPSELPITEDFYPMADLAAVNNDRWTGAGNYRLLIGAGTATGYDGMSVTLLEIEPHQAQYNALKGAIYGQISYALLDSMGVQVGSSYYIAKMKIDDTHEFQSYITIDRHYQSGSRWIYSFEYTEKVVEPNQMETVITYVDSGLSVSTAASSAPYYVGIALIPIVKATSTAYYLRSIFSRYSRSTNDWPMERDESWYYEYTYTYQSEDLSIVTAYMPQWANGRNLYGAVFNLDMYCRENEIDFVVKEISPEAGLPSDTGGMNQDGDVPSFDDSSDSIALPDDPTVGVANVGFVNVYKTGAASLQNMGVELFPALSYTAPTAISSGSTTDAIVDGFNAIVTFLANIPSFFEQTVAATLINYIIDCHVIPVTPSSGTLEQIKVGYKTLSCYGERLTNDYVTFDCGTINLSEYYANFADFLNTSKIFLPFVGFVPARPEWYLRDSLNITYKFNIIDGSFMAYIRSTGRYVNNNNSGPTVVGQYSGNACVHLPITGVTYSNMVSGLVGAGSGAVASAGSGSIAGAATSALNAANLHGDMPSSNAYSSSGSFLSVRRPFLMIERPVSSYSRTYQREIGIPSNISVKLSSARGFATVGDVHLDGITATDQEKAELEKLLSQGVIF